MRVLAAKELSEMVRTHRVILLPALFVVLGIVGPAVIRLLPLIVRQAGQQMNLEIPDMGPADGLAQYLSLTRQIGVLAIVVVFMGLLATERKEGTLAMLFVKPVSRWTYLGCRWLVNAAYVVISFLAGTGVAILYTALLLGTPRGTAMMAASGLYASYLLLVFSFTYLCSSLLRNAAAAGGLSLVPALLFPLLGNVWKPLGQWGPYGAVNAGSAWIGATGMPAQPIPVSGVVSALLNAALSLGLLACAYLVLRRAEL